MYELLKEPEHLGRDLWQYGPIQRYNVNARGGRTCSGISQGSAGTTSKATAG